MTAPPKLGVLAGRGNLPRQVIAAALGEGREVFVVAFENETDPETVAMAPDHVRVGLAAVERIIKALRRAQVEEVVFAGPVGRPSFSTLKPDRRGLKLLGRIARGGLGDDGILSLAVAELEEEGFAVVGADDILPEVLAPEGALGRLHPDDDARRDIDRAVQVARALGAVDVGQAVVVQQQIVLGVEAAEGTDALIERCASLRRPGPGGVLVKIKKPGQERRADLPTIGVRTVEKAAASGLRGIAVEAGATLLMDRDAIGRAADALRLFVAGIHLDR